MVNQCTSCIYSAKHQSPVPISTLMFSLHTNISNQKQLTQFSLYFLSSAKCTCCSRSSPVIGQLPTREIAAKKPPFVVFEHPLPIGISQWDPQTALSHCTGPKLLPERVGNGKPPFCFCRLVRVQNWKETKFNPIFLICNDHRSLSTNKASGNLALVFYSLSF